MADGTTATLDLELEEIFEKGSEEESMPSSADASTISEEVASNFVKVTPMSSVNAKIWLKDGGPPLLIVKIRTPSVDYNSFMFEEFANHFSEALRSKESSSKVVLMLDFFKCTKIPSLSFFRSFTKWNKENKDLLQSRVYASVVVTSSKMIKKAVQLAASAFGASSSKELFCVTSNREDAERFALEAATRIT